MIMSLSPRLVEALGWTLIHALWQGALLALIPLLCCAVFKDLSVRARYGLFGAAMAALPLLSLFTFYMYHTGDPGGLAVASLASQAMVESSGASTVIAHSIGDSFPLLLNLWLLGVACFSLKTAGGYLYSRSLLDRETADPDPMWQERLAELVARMGIRRKVRMLVSFSAQVPMVLGHVKPVILMPFSVLMALPTDQVEAVLLHELGHIKRNDYLLNILQTLLEGVYFFHPAVWWMSGNLRSLRECCCDDLAVATVGNRLTLARALAQLQEVHMKSPNLVMALSSDERTLSGRISRVVQPKPSSRRQSLAATMLLICGVVVMAHGMAMAGSNQDEVPAEVAAQLKDLFGESSEHQRIRINDTQYEIRMEAGKLVDWRIDGKSQPLAQIERILPTLRDLEKQKQRAEKSRREAEMHREQAEQLRQQAEVTREQAQQFREQAERMREQMSLQREQAERMREQAELHREQAERMREQMSLQRKQAEQMREQMDQQREKMERIREETEPRREEVERMREQTELQREELERMREQVEPRIEAFQKQQEQLEQQRQLMEEQHETFEVQRKEMEAQAQEMERQAVEVERRLNDVNGKPVKVEKENQ